MSEQTDRLITFDSTHQALRAEMLLDAEGAEFMVIPTPRELTANCGLAISYRSGDEERIASALARGAVRIEARYAVTPGEGRRRDYVRLDQLV